MQQPVPDPETRPLPGLNAFIEPSYRSDGRCSTVAAKEFNLATKQKDTKNSRGKPSREFVLRKTLAGKYIVGMKSMSVF